MHDVCDIHVIHDMHVDRQTSGGKTHGRTDLQTYRLTDIHAIHGTHVMCAANEEFDIHHIHDIHDLHDQRKSRSLTSDKRDR